MEKVLEFITVFVTAYLIGSIPTGYIIVKTFTGQDIRTIGSGSTGATNVKRVMGKKWFFITMLLDALKGALPVILAKLFATTFTGIGLLPVVAAVAVILGHSRSIFLKFTGGKSVASGVGTILALNYTSKYVSLGSIIAMAVSPFLMWWFKAPVAYTIYCALGAVYIIWLHRSNIQRLLKGEENKVR